MKITKLICCLFRVFIVLLFSCRAFCQETYKHTFEPLDNLPAITGKAIEKKYTQKTHTYVPQTLIVRDAENVGFLLQKKSNGKWSVYALPEMDSHVDSFSTTGRFIIYNWFSGGGSNNTTWSVTKCYIIDIKNHSYTSFDTGNELESSENIEQGSNESDADFEKRQEAVKPHTEEC